MFQNTLNIVSICVVITYCNAFKTGAPASVCVSMVPEHGVPPQPLPSPYTLTVDKTRIKAGDNVTVTIKAKGKDTFKGFMLQARESISQQDGTNKPIGHFQTKSGSNYQPITCSGGYNTITHTANDDKSAVVATWTATGVKKGPMYFLLTVAKDGGKFWVGQKSPIMTVS